MIYGNHDLMDYHHLQMRNAASGLPALLPHGAISVVPSCSLELVVAELSVEPCAQLLAQSDTAAYIVVPSCLASGTTVPMVPPDQLVGLTKSERAALYARCKFEKRPTLSKQEKQEKQWSDQNPAQAALLNQFRARVQPTSLLASDGNRSVRIGAVHGIPASHSEGLRKLGRNEYFQAAEAVCGMPLDILVTHSNPRLPGQDAIVHGEDAPRLFELFMRSSAVLHVHGHMHTHEVVSVVKEGKVVVNSDCRVVVFVPP